MNKKILKNNITVLWENLPYIKSCSIAVVLKIGARDEKKKTMGYSHFLEHMFFKGTKKRSAYDIAYSLEKKGGYLNAMTGYENTWFEARCLSEDLPLAIEILGDMISNSLHTEIAIKAEKKVVSQEIKSITDSSEDLIYELFFQKIFKNHSMGNPIYGTIKNIKSLERSELIRFYNKHFNYNNTIIAIAGNIDVDIFSLINKHFILKQGKTCKREKIENLSVGKINFTRKKTNQLHLIIGGKSYSANEDERYQFQVLINILGGGISSRLFQLLREKNPLVYSVYSFYHSYSDIGIGGLYLSTAVKNRGKIIKLLEEEFKKISQDAITKESVDNSKNQLRGSLIITLESTKARVSKILNNEIYFGRYISIEEMNDNISSITYEKVQQIANIFFQKDNLLWTFLSPGG